MAARDSALECKRTTRARPASLLLPLLLLWGAFHSSTASKQPDLLGRSRFISLDSSASKIDIDLDLSVPFLSIPLQGNDAQGSGLPMPLLKLNTKALAVFGTLMAISAFVIPLLVKQSPEQRSPAPHANLRQRTPYRYEDQHISSSDRAIDISHLLGDSLSGVLRENDTLVPCIERLVCSVVAVASHSERPTSFDQIVVALSSHRLFEEVLNGTLIKEAADRGRQALSPEDCAATSTQCLFNRKILLNLSKIIGL